jgi:tRNA pseudouridine65 synthase
MVLDNEIENPLEIIYQDKHLVAINKPSGLLVHRSYIDRHETRFAVQILRDQLGQYVYPVHRLDKPTSGILLFALNAEFAQQMGTLFSERQTQKTYLAVVRGYTIDKDTIDYTLVEELDKIADKHAKEKEAQDAVTDYQTLAQTEFNHPVGRYQTARYSLVKLTPKTGRKHQLRRHLKHIYHPIVGDTTHGDGKQNQFFREQLNCHRLLLAATQLAFIHPQTKKNIVINATIDGEFKQIIKHFEQYEL